MHSPVAVAIGDRESGLMYAVRRDVYTYTVTGATVKNE